MNIENLTKRTQAATKKHSLRSLAKGCDVSYETIRLLKLAEPSLNITANTYNKIDKGLALYGF